MSLSWDPYGFGCTTTATPNETGCCERCMAIGVVEIEHHAHGADAWELHLCASCLREIALLARATNQPLETDVPCEDCKPIRAELARAQAEANHLRQLLASAALLVSECNTTEADWLETAAMFTAEVDRLREKPWLGKPGLG